MRKIFLLIGVHVIYCYHTAVWAQLQLNEISPCNTSGLSDEENDIHDWIEIYNTASAPVLLSSWYLSDDPAVPQKWNFPGFSIAPNGYLIVFCSGKNLTDSILHTNFGLKKKEKLLLTNGTTVIDSLTIPILSSNLTFSKTGGSYVYYATPTPGGPNTFPFSEVLSVPVLSLDGGFYPSAVTLSMTHPVSTAEIRYTLDGTDPGPSSNLYTGAIMLSGPTPGNVWSNIPTNPSFAYPVGDYDSVRANNRGWLSPYTNSNKSVVVRARAFQTGMIPSAPVSSGFFIDPMLSSRYTLPVISIIADSSALFGSENGIYVYGNHSDGNYNQTGDAWEIPVTIQLFNTAGELQINTLCGARVHGGGGRHSTLKSLQLYFRDDYGLEKVKLGIFDRYIEQTFHNLLLRSPGHRPDCFPRDELGVAIAGRLRFDKAKSQHVIAYLNGEYWGIHSMKEMLNKNYLSEKYNLEEQEITILDAEGHLEKGNPADTSLFSNLENFIHGADLSLEGNYTMVKNQVDINNYIDYYCSEIFLGNADWPHSNLQWWRKNTSAGDGALAYGHDGRWRLIFYDLDGGFGGTCNGTFPTFNTLEHATDTSALVNSYAEMFRDLLTNVSFKNQFVNRMCDLLNSSFSYSKTKELLDSVTNTLDPEMLEHVNRWRYPSIATTLIARASEVPSTDRWDQIKNELDFYLLKRPSFQRKHLYNYFSFTDSSIITLNVNDTMSGYVRVNSLHIDKKLDGIKGATYPWKGIYFNDVAVSITAVPHPGSVFLYWLETGNTASTLTVNLTTDSTFTAIFGVDTTYDPNKYLCINEVASANKELINDEFNEADDWFEIYNHTNTMLDLAGYYVSDDPTLPLKYQFPSGDTLTKIKPHGFKLIWADDQISQGALHCNFKLEAAGELLLLTAPDGITRIDSVSFHALPKDFSYGSLPNGSDSRIDFYYPTPGLSNDLNTIYETEAVPDVFIFPNPAGNELFIHAKSPQVGFATLWNPDGKEMGKWLLEKSQVTRIDISQVPNGICFLRVNHEKGNETFKIVIAK